ncbi:MAG: PD-(D/E)XK nuclease family protein, partial [Verrucomicrobiota bacterium]
ERSQHYPQLFQPPGKAATLAISACHEVSAARARQARILRQSYARLLYVTLTRARNRLILVDDQALFPQSQGSFADHLQVQDGQPNASWWSDLSVYQDTTQAYPAKARASEGASLPALPATTDQTLRPVDGYPRRVLPSSLAKHEPTGGHHRDESDLRTEPSLPEVAVAAAARQGADYGNWWHLMMETLPWSESIDAWRAHTKDSLAQLKPNLRERGQQELERFLGSELAERLSSPAWTIRTELPVFWPDGEGAVYDGLIDLTARHEDGSVLVIDWKTDLLGDDGLSGLRATYGPQLDCYRRALTDLFSATVEALLYSTRAAATVAL